MSSSGSKLADGAVSGLAFIGRTTTTVSLVILVLLSTMWISLWWGLFYSPMRKRKAVTARVFKCLGDTCEIYFDYDQKAYRAQVSLSGTHASAGKDVTIYIDPNDATNVVWYNPSFTGFGAMFGILVLGPLVVVGLAYWGYRFAHRSKETGAISGASAVLSRTLR